MKLIINEKKYEYNIKEQSNYSPPYREGPGGGSAIVLAPQ